VRRFEELSSKIRRSVGAILREWANCWALEKRVGEVFESGDGTLFSLPCWLMKEEVGGSI